MGHYRSEMVDVDKERLAKLLNRGDLVVGIEHKLNTEGLASVIADLLEDVHISGMRNRCRELGARIRTAK